LQAAAKNIDTSIGTGRHSDRIGPRRVSEAGLLEVRVTPRGANPPHLRLLVIREQRTLWAVDGFKKQKNKIRGKDVNAADAMVREWKERTVR